MNSISVKELADELNITKQAVHKRIKQLPPALKPKLVKGAYRLSVETADLIRSSVEVTPTGNQPVNLEVDGAKKRVNKKSNASYDTEGINHQITSDNHSLGEEFFAGYQIKDMIEKSIVDAIKESTLEATVNVQSSTDNQAVDEKVTMLKEIIEDLKKDKDKLYKQVNEQNERLKEAQKNLDQQQQLGLQMQLQNNKLQLELEKYEEEKEVKNQTSPKKWWNFFK